MNYRKHYNLLIDKAKNRVHNGYTEKHHIIPRSEGGIDDNSNIVKLTAREHFVAHWLLFRENPSKSRAYAFHLMCNSNLNEHRYTPSSRTIAEAREARQYYKPSQESVQKMIKSKKGFKHTEETKQKIKEKKKNTHISEETKQKMSKAALGKIKHTEESKSKISQSMSGKLINNKIILQYNLDGNFIKEWISVTEAKKYYKGDIYACCQGRAKTAGGFIWKFKIYE